MDTNDGAVNEECEKLAAIGRRIRLERQRIGLSQADLAALVGVHRKTQGNYELGARKPDVAYLQALAKAEIDIGYVVTGKSNNEVLQACRNVLDSILVGLGLFKGFQLDLNAILELSRENYRRFLTGNPDAAASVDAAVAALLARSPRLISGPDDLAELIERVEFVADSLGVGLSPSDKGNVLWRLMEEKSAKGVKQADFAMIRAVIQRGG